MAEVKNLSNEECYVLKDDMIHLTQEQFSFLKHKADGNPKVCEGNDCPFQRFYNNKIFSWSHFTVGFVKLLVSVEFWIFVITTVLFIMYAKKDVPTYWISYVIMGGVFMFFKPLSALIGRGNLNIDAKLGANAGATLTKNLTSSKD